MYHKNLQLSYQNIWSHGSSIVGLSHIVCILYEFHIYSVYNWVVARFFFWVIALGILVNETHWHCNSYGKINMMLRH